MPRTVLVTGASGFIGAPTCAALLQEGFDVHGLTRDAAKARDAHPAIRWHEGDVLDVAGMKKLLAALRPDNLVAAAWETTHGSYWHDPINLDWVAASLHLVKNFREQGGARALIVGTCMEYVPEGEALCDARATPTGPHHLYGTAKDALRRVLENYAGGQGLSLAWARLFLLFGPGENPKRLVPSLAAKLRAGEAAPISSGVQRRDFIDSRDAGRALARVLASDHQGPINVASGHDFTLAEIARAVGAALGRPELVQVGALPDRPGEPPRLVADVAPLKKLGFSVTPDEILARLKEVVCDAA